MDENIDWIMDKYDILDNDTGLYEEFTGNTVNDPSGYIAYNEVIPSKTDKDIFKDTQTYKIVHRNISEEGKNQFTGRNLYSLAAMFERVARDYKKTVPKRSSTLSDYNPKIRDIFNELNILVFIGVLIPLLP